MCSSVADGMLKCREITFKNWNDVCKSGQKLCGLSMCVNVHKPERLCECIQVVRYFTKQYLNDEIIKLWIIYC